MTAAMTKLLQRLMGTVQGNVRHPPSQFALIVSHADARAARDLEAIGVVEIVGNKARRASTQPAPAFPREEAAKLIQAVERYAFKRGYEEGQDDAAAGVDEKSPSIAIFLCGMDVARECDAEEPGARILALLQGKQP